MAKALKATALLAGIGAASTMLLLAAALLWPLVGEQPNASATRVQRGIEERPESTPRDAPPDLQAWLAQERVVTAEPLLAGNGVELLSDGPPALRAKLQAIQGAMQSIHMIMYKLADDAAGQQVVAALVARQRSGVQVRMIYDGFGSIHSEELLAPLAAAGAQLHRYRPIVPANLPTFWRLHKRQHSKLLIVDGTRAFTGGMNIHEVYLESARAPGDGDQYRAWRDTHIVIEGPAVARLQAAFLRQWAELGEAPAEEEAGHSREQPATGTAFVRVVETAENHHAIYATYLTAASRAQERLWLTHAYFVPDEALLQALEQAAMRGVDVRILLPGLIDTRIVQLAARHNYERLLRSGVRLFERHDNLVHAKTAVADGIWATVGSANFDYRSFIHQRELNVVIADEAFASGMEALFRQDLAKAEEITLHGWRKRPLAQRIGERLAALFRYWF
jgi:cardiolipin synthase A/B